MDAGLNTSFEGYQSVGTIPPVLAARQPEKRSQPGENSDVFSPTGLLTARLLSAKNCIVFLIGQSTLRRRLFLPAGTAAQNFGRLHPLNSPVQVRVPQAYPRPWSSSQQPFIGAFVVDMKTYFRKPGAYSTSVSSFALP